MGDSSSQLHLRLMTHINGELHPSLREKWRKFTNMIDDDLGKATINKCKDFTQLAGELMDMSLIAVGDYNFLSKIFGTIQLIQLQNHVITSQKEIRDAMKREGKELSTGPPKTGSTDKPNEKLKEFRILQSEMINHVAKDLNPAVPNLWRRFTNSYIFHYFSEDKMKECETFEDLFNMLMDENLITVGNYEVLTSALSSIDLKKMQKEVEDFEKQIKTAFSKEAKDPKAASVDKWPDYLRLHYEMMKHISGTVSPGLDIWNTFKMFIGQYLDRAQISQCKVFADVFNKLMAREQIGYGQYDLLVKIFNDIKLIKLKHEVEDYQRKIKDAMEQEKKVEKIENTPRESEGMAEAVADDWDQEEDMDLK